VKPNPSVKLINCSRPKLRANLDPHKHIQRQKNYDFFLGGNPVCCVSNCPFFGCPIRLGAVDKATDDFSPAPVLFLRRALL
jgi:hypothetical protein